MLRFQSYFGHYKNTPAVPQLCSFHAVSYESCLLTQTLFHWLLYVLLIELIWKFVIYEATPLLIWPFWYVHTCVYRDWHPWLNLDNHQHVIYISNLLVHLIILPSIIHTIMPTFWKTMLCEQSFQGKVCVLNARKGLDWVQRKPWNSININYSARSGQEIAVNETAWTVG